MEEKQKKKRKNIIKLVILGGIVLLLIVFKLVLVFQSNSNEVSYEVVEEQVKQPINTDFNVTDISMNLGGMEDILFLMISMAVAMTAIAIFILPLFRRRGL